MMLSIDTHSEDPRPVGGGLDEPTTTPKAAIPASSDRRRRRRARTATTAVVSAPEPATAAEEPVPPNNDDGPDELELVRRALLELAPAPRSDASALELVRVLGLKLDGHARYVAELRTKPGSIDNARRRVGQLLFDLSDTERQAVLVLITADIRQGVPPCTP